MQLELFKLLELDLLPNCWENDLKFAYMGNFYKQIKQIKQPVHFIPFFVCEWCDMLQHIKQDIPTLNTRQSVP